MPPMELEIVLDELGSDSRTWGWDFSNYPEIIAGDTLASSPVPEITQVAPAGNPSPPSLTIGDPQITGPIADPKIEIAGVLANVTVTDGTPGLVYKTVCTVQTAAGKILKLRGNFVLVGPS